MEPLSTAMIDALFSQPQYIAAKKMLDVTALRMEAVAANLANIETPNYRRVDVPQDFEQRLQQLIRSGDSRSVSNLRPQLAVDTTANALRPDGNTVDLESEMVRLYRTSVEHGVETHLITGGLLKLRMAITGRPS